MPVKMGRKTTVQLIRSSALEMILSTGSVSRNHSASSSETRVRPEARYITMSGNAGQPTPLTRRMNSMCGA